LLIILAAAHVLFISSPGHLCHFEGGAAQKKTRRRRRWPVVASPERSNYVYLTAELAYILLGKLHFSPQADT
jgi:hypothetical protein